LIFTARRYASAVYAVIVCLRQSVRLSVRSSHESVFYQDGFTSASANVLQTPIRSMSAE